MCQLKYISKMGKESIYINFKIRLLKNLRNKREKIIKNLNSIKEFGLASSYKRLFELVSHSKNKSEKKHKKNPFHVHSTDLKKGNLVKIKSKEEILKTLDENGRLEGCALMKEMWQYCGSKQEVLKKVTYFFDERYSKFLKARNTVLLKGLQCGGEIFEGAPKCDRLCYFFWREEWLEKIN